MMRILAFIQLTVVAVLLILASSTKDPTYLLPGMIGCGFLGVIAAILSLDSRKD